MVSELDVFDERSYQLNCSTFSYNYEIKDNNEHVSNRWYVELSSYQVLKKQ